MGGVDTHGHESFRLAPGSIALALALKYTGLVVYGLWAAFVEVPSFVVVGGSGFAIGWAATVTILALLALGAVLRSWFTDRYRFEKWATAGLILGFTSYSVVLIVRSSILADWDSIPLALLPVLLSIFPAIRYYSLVARQAREADE